ncbi:MAG TPA: Fic family protein, partial [Chloroflexia bacterium]|nr:Fic family protein [Chloroflexia bacterium]
LKLALSYIEMLAAGEMPLTERLIRILHAVVMKGLTTEGAESGSYRSDDLTTLADGVPTAAEVIPEMGTFGRWLALKPRSPEYESSPIVRAVFAHTRLLHIHPFREGNGRVARLLLNLVLLRSGFPLVTLDGAQRAIYLRGLNAASGSGDSTILVGMTLDAVDGALSAYQP